MSVSAVICEFNPFHNGHRYLLEKAKEDGSFIICIMSGNYVQRGDIAVCDKFLRAQEAVRNGADLVVELPLPYACAPAETFARGAVSLLNKLNIVDKLYFGAENSIDEIISVFEITETEIFKEKLLSLMKDGLSYPDAFFEAAGKECLSGGNDILALEYIRQLKSSCSAIKPVTVKRTGNEHNSNVASGEFASASLIREKIRNGDDYSGFSTLILGADEISDISKIEIAILSKLRQMNENDFSHIADVTEGLEYRFVKAAGQARCIEDIIENVKTRRYTISKLRRIIISAFLGITKEMQNYIPSYINVLASSDTGVKLISEIKKNSAVKPVIRYSDTALLNKDDMKLYNFTVSCDDIFGLALPVIRPAGYDKTRKFSIIK